VNRYAELRELAESLPFGRGWEYNPDFPNEVAVGLEPLLRVSATYGAHPLAEYIAAASPDVILALLDEREELEARVRDFAATWHVAYGHKGHLDDCNWSTCLHLLTGEIKRGAALLQESVEANL
jgi:hypothetical protein